MVSILPSDSKAVFDRMIAERNLDAFKPKIKALGWSTASDLAHSCGLNYQTTKTKDFIRNVICKALDIPYQDYKRTLRSGTEPPEANQLKKLFNKAGLMLTADLKQVGTVVPEAQPS